MCRQNCLRVRAKINDYVQARKQGKIKSKMDGNDLLTLFMQNTEIFTDTFIIDELLDFFLAAMVTTQSVT